MEHGVRVFPYYLLPTAYSLYFMIRKTLEVSISKEEIRTVDESGTKASTWVKIGQTIELEEGDIPDMCMKALRAEIQPEVDAWLLDQGGYIVPPGVEIPEAEERLSDELFSGTQVKITEVGDDAGDDEIPL
ncbi:MAG: hypothetical protein L6R45_10385 [Anaerolineae bacterium]|nr:hypothetical protein [Anaerolineae bacterium]